MHETSNFVIPAKAGIQDVDETVDFNFWTPAFAGVTSSFFNSLLMARRTKAAPAHPALAALVRPCTA